MCDYDVFSEYGVGFGVYLNLSFILDDEQTQALHKQRTHSHFISLSSMAVLCYILNVAGHGLIQCSGLVQSRMGPGIDN